MHQDEQALQRRVHRETVHIDVPGTASTRFIEALENDCGNVNILTRKILLPERNQGEKSVSSPRFVRRSSISTILVFESHFTASRVSIELLLDFFLSVGCLMLDNAIINSSSYHTSCRLVVRTGS